MRREGPEERETRPEEPTPESEEEARRREDRDHLRDLRRVRQARVAKALVALVLLGLFGIFIVSNSGPTEVDFVFVTSEPPLIWVMVGCAVIGGIVGYLIGRPARGVRLHREPEKRDHEDE